MSNASFETLFKQATGFDKSLPYQSCLALAALFPSLLDVSTGLGKTAAVTLAWVWRRRFAEENVRNQTPRRLVYCLPMRVLVEQTYGEAVKWLERLGLLAGAAQRTETGTDGLPTKTAQLKRGAEGQGRGYELKDDVGTMGKVQTVSGLLELGSSDLAELIPAVLEFLGMEEEHTERELKQAILANLRDFFLEFGKGLTFVGEEYPLTVGGDTFYVDLLFFQRQLQCLIAIDLKKGKFKPGYAGKCRFYCAALDEFIKLPHENPSLDLVLCRSADAVQVRLALTDAAEKIGVATYQTALPDERIIRQRIEQIA